jgi:hypothetical protein
MTQHGLRSCGAPFRRDGIRSEASLDVAHQGCQPGQHHHGIKQRPRRPAVLRPPDKDITRSRTRGRKEKAPPRDGAPVVPLPTIYRRRRLIRARPQPALAALHWSQYGGRL